MQNRARNNPQLSNRARSSTQSVGCTINMLDEDVGCFAVVVVTTAALVGFIMVIGALVVPGIMLAPIVVIGALVFPIVVPSVTPGGRIGHASVRTGRIGHASIRTDRCSAHAGFHCIGCLGMNSIDSDTEKEQQ